MKDFSVQEIVPDKFIWIQLYKLFWKEQHVTSLSN